MSIKSDLKVKKVRTLRSAGYLLILLCMTTSVDAMQYEINDLESLQGYTLGNYAQGMNDYGDVVGVAAGTGFSKHAFKWDSSTGMTDLGSFSGHRDSRAIDINNSGYVVGYSDNGGFDARSFLWDSINGMQTLGTLGGRYDYAWSINESGHVVGYAENASFHNTAYYWDDINGMQSLGTLGGSSSSALGINDSD